MGSINLLEQLIGLRTLTFTSLLKNVIRNRGDHSDEEIDRVDLGGFQTQELLSTWSWGASPSKDMDVFINLEVL